MKQKNFLQDEVISLLSNYLWRHHLFITLPTF